MQSRRTVLAPVIAGVVLVGSSLPAELGSWRDRPVSGWTQEDAYQVLTNSPWVKNVRATVLHEQSEFERRDGGNMGRAHGPGFDGMSDKKDAKIGQGAVAGMVRTLLLRWESALPVRAAGLKAHTVEPPTLDTDSYVLAVYGVPGDTLKGDPLKLGKPLRDLAVLRREGKKDVKPARVEVFQGGDGLIIAYEFPRTLEITKDDKSFLISAVIGRLSFNQPFDTEAMHFQGKLEF